MSNDDLIRRRDALNVCLSQSTGFDVAQSIAALHAVTSDCEARLVAALQDLMSWFPVEPSDPEWRIKGGEMGADDAIDYARDLLAELETK
jgi:hypothetical protein